RLSSVLAEAGTAPIGGDAFVAIRVADDGVGVKTEQRAEIFEPFVQGESGNTRTRGGSGVGLAISRRLARLMNGDITVSSEAGHGASFTLWLPSAGEPVAGTTAEQQGLNRKAPPGDPVMLAQVGRLLAADALALGQALAVRLRTDDRFPPSGGLS